MTINRVITVVLGDVNTKVGNGNITREIIMGKEGLGSMNESKVKK